MSNAAKDGFGNDDVLASIRRLVAEESARGEARGAPASDEPQAREAEPEIRFEAPKPARVFQRRRSTDSAGLVDRQSINRAARAKLLLTDDFRVAELKRQAEAQVQEEAHVQESADRSTFTGDLDDLPTKPEIDLDAIPADASENDEKSGADQSFRRSPLRKRTSFDDAEQTKLSEEIDGFLGSTQGDTPEVSDAGEPPVGSDQPIDLDALLGESEQGIAIEDIPDDVLPAAETRAKRRRAASARATEVSQASAAMRTPPEPVGVEAEATPEDVSEPAQARDSSVLATATVAQIEEAVQASLHAYMRETEVAAPQPTEIDIDPEMLRDMVSEIVRRELQGSLGERITRNVRKLVRREIYRALETRDLG